MHPRILYGVVALLALFIGPLHAALPLDAIRQFQEAAPEKLRIEVTEATKRERRLFGGFEFRMNVTAKVIAVTASASGLKVGDEIRIRYSFPNFEKSPAAGDWPGEVSAGTIYDAFLEAKDAAKKRYDPAAHSGSFEGVERKP